MPTKINDSVDFMIQGMTEFIRREYKPAESEAETRNKVEVHVRSICRNFYNAMQAKDTGGTIIDPRKSIGYGDGRKFKT